MSSNAGSHWIGKSGTAWSESDDDRLAELWRGGRTADYMSDVLARSSKAIRDRMELLGLTNDPSEIHDAVTAYLRAHHSPKPPKGARYRDANGDWWWWVATKGRYHNESERVRRMQDAKWRGRKNAQVIQPRDVLSPEYDEGGAA